MSSPRPSWRPLLAGTAALFLVILAFLAGQLKAGGDPALGRTPAAVQQTTDGTTGTPPQSGGSDPSGGDDGFGTDPDDGFVPGGSAPAPAVPDGSSTQPPTTHQS